MRNPIQMFFLPISTAALSLTLTSSLLGFYDCSALNFSTFGGVESFRGMPDLDNGDNNGLFLGAEMSGPLPYLSKYDIGFQIGGSAGAYDFAGRLTNLGNNKTLQGQQFLTVGTYILPSAFCPIGIGFAYDVMFNQNYGFYVQNPTLQQVRGKVSYFVRAIDELGFWGTYDIKTTKSSRDYGFFDYEVSYRPIAQANFFWRHLYGSGVESTLWVGLPYRERLNRKKSNWAGKFIIGGECVVPFLDTWMIVGRACYMQPGTKRGCIGAQEYVSNIAITLVYNFGGNPSPCESNRWSPYLSVANNSNFFVDIKAKAKNFMSSFPVY